jgi:hypothetical protein
MEAFEDRDVRSAVKSCPMRATEDDQAMHWIAIELVGEDDQPIPWEEFKVVLPTGEVAVGFLDEKGSARVDAIPVAGMCKISFPRLDQDLWYSE